MLAWSRDVLTERSHVSKRTIVDFERGARSPMPAPFSPFKPPSKAPASSSSMKTEVVRGSGSKNRGSQAAANENGSMYDLHSPTIVWSNRRTNGYDSASRHQ